MKNRKATITKVAKKDNARVSKQQKAQKCGFDHRVATKEHEDAKNCHHQKRHGN